MVRTWLRSRAPLAAAFALALCPHAHAQDQAAADALFQRGVAEMKAGHFVVGCPQIAESQRLDPRPGTLFTLADCEAKRGRIATASTLFGDYIAQVERMDPAQQAKHNDRKKVAQERRAEIGPKIPTLTLVLPPSAPAGTEVRRDDVTLGAPALGVALPVDPGKHVIVTRAPGGPAHEVAVDLLPGDNTTIKLEIKPAPQAAASAPVPGPQAAPIASAPSSAPPSAPPPAGGETASSGRRTWGYVALGAGALGLAVGGVAGALTLGKRSTIDDHCEGTLCDHDGKTAADAAKTTGLISTVGFGVGLAAATAGVVLVLTSPSSSRSVGLAPSVGPGSASASLVGSF